MANLSSPLTQKEGAGWRFQEPWQGVTPHQGWVNVGIGGDTAAFAVESVRRWWQRLGKSRYPATKRLHLTADSGGSNGARVRLWKRELQKLANETGLEVTVTHLPPGTSKWNKIEHRLFSFIPRLCEKPKIPLCETAGRIEIGE
jgi:Rhodopirellula transposase DDE domain